MIIRVATPMDAPGVRAIYAPFVEQSYTSFEVETPSFVEMAERIANTLVDWPWLVCLDANYLVGFAYARQHRTREAYQWSVDCTLYVHATHRRRGIGRMLYSALFEILARQGFYNAYAGVALPNEASCGLHEALGFTMVGTYHHVGFKMGAWHDVAWYERQLRPLDQQPSPPLPFSLFAPRQVVQSILDDASKALHLPREG